MSEPRLIGDIIRDLNARINSGEPVHVGGFVYFMTGHIAWVLTEREYEDLADGDSCDFDK